MAILDRFRTHAGHKHPDAAARLEFVEELPLDQRELIAEIAREDADPRVRRAAAAKLMDPSTLAQVARDDADEGVRAQANAMLRDIALEAFEGFGKPDLATWTPCSIPRRSASSPRAHRANRARSAALDADRRRPRARLDCARIRRTSRCAPAFESLRDQGEILSVALNSEFKDPTVAAVDRIRIGPSSNRLPRTSRRTRAPRSAPGRSFARWTSAPPRSKRRPPKPRHRPQPNWRRSRPNPIPADVARAEQACR